MIMKFKCRMEEYDGEEEWSDVNEHDAQTAAETYSEYEDSRSAMEIFQNENERIVLVKDANGIIKKFLCSREAVVRYNANEVDPVPEPESDIPV